MRSERHRQKCDRAVTSVVLFSLLAMPIWWVRRPLPACLDSFSSQALPLVKRNIEKRAFYLVVPKVSQRRIAVPGTKVRTDAGDAPLLPVVLPSSGLKRAPPLA